MPQRQLVINSGKCSAAVVNKIKLKPSIYSFSLRRSCGWFYCSTFHCSPSDFFVRWQLRPIQTTKSLLPLQSAAVWWQEIRRLRAATTGTIHSCRTSFITYGMYLPTHYFITDGMYLLTQYFDVISPFTNFLFPWYLLLNTMGLYRRSSACALDSIYYLLTLRELRRYTYLLT